MSTLINYNQFEFASEKTLKRHESRFDYVLKRKKKKKEKIKASLLPKSCVKTRRRHLVDPEPQEL